MINGTTMTPYTNVTVTLANVTRSQVTFGSVKGADSYELSSGLLTIASVVYQNPLYTDVVVKDVSIAEVVLPIAGGMPTADHDEYTNPLLSIPAVQVVGGDVYTDVSVHITPSQVVSINGVPF